MADERDDAERTEEATSKRLDDAEKKGDVLQSAEAGHFAMLSAGLAALMVIAGVTAPHFGMRLAGFFDHAAEMPLDATAGVGLLAEVGRDVAYLIGVPLLLLVVTAIGHHRLQHPIVFSTEKLKPDLGKLSPIKGLGRIFSRRGLMEFVKGILKLAAVGTGAVMAVLPLAGHLVETVGMDPRALGGVIVAAGLRLFLGALAVLAVIAVGDYLFQRFERLRRLRMSRQEIKDENKQAEGDPAVKSRQRQLGRTRARRRMMAAVPGADVVIVNPTHYAVALKYHAEAMRAPKVVAKGVDLVARRIRDLAEESGVPILSNPPLTRALYAAVDIDEEIPPEHYRAVAEVIGFVFKRRRSRPAQVRE